MSTAAIAGDSVAVREARASSHWAATASSAQRSQSLAAAALEDRAAVVLAAEAMLAIYWTRPGRAGKFFTPNSESQTLSPKP